MWFRTVSVNFNASINLINNKKYTYTTIQLLSSPISQAFWLWTWKFFFFHESRISCSFLIHMHPFSRFFLNIHVQRHRNYQKRYFLASLQSILSIVLCHRDTSRSELSLKNLGFKTDNDQDPHSHPQPRLFILLEPKAAWVSTFTLWLVVMWCVVGTAESIAKLSNRIIKCHIFIVVFHVSLFFFNTQDES